MKFYTNVAIYGSNVLVREIVDGIPNMRKEEWKPTLYVRGKPRGETSEFKTLQGETVYSIQPGSIPDCKEFVTKYEDVPNYDIYGQLNYSLQYMNEYQVSGWTNSLLQIWSIDIETLSARDSEGNSSFPKPKDALGEIVLITLVNMRTGQAFTFGSKEYTGKDTSYLNCGNEAELLRQFVSFWEQKRIDIITGWHINGFDIPYCINRIESILGKEWVNRLSPWGKVSCKHRVFMGQDEFAISIVGISVLDYLDLYKKYTYEARESYSLDFIANIELGENKLDHSEWETFDAFYHGDFPKYVRYNIHDTQLVRLLDEKMTLIDIVLTIAYEAKLNYEDVSSPVKCWDALIANYALTKNIVMPQARVGYENGQKVDDEHLEGAYVKEPIPGWYYDILTLDATSLYPSNIITNNISPETYIGNCGLGIEDFLNGVKIDVDEQYIVTPAGAIYSKKKQGLIPELMSMFMKKRKTVKTEMLQTEQEYENTRNQDLKAKIASLNNLQMAIKILLNSGYGALANKYFRFFKHDHAASVTLTGQYLLKSIERKIDSDLNKAFGTENVRYLQYIDTDSLLFAMKPILDKFNVPQDKRIKTLEKLSKDKLTPLVNKICKECCDYMRSYENMINFKAELAGTSAIMVKKKKYVIRVCSSEGVTYAKPKFKIKGLELVRSSTPQYVRDQLKKSLDLIFDTDEKTVQNFISTVQDEFSQLDYTKIASPRGANNLLEYSDDKTIYGKKTPFQVRGVLLYNHYLKQMKLDNKYPLIGEGDKIKFVYVKTPNRFKENVIAFPVDGIIPPEFGIIDRIDYDTQFEKTFLASMQIVLDAIKWKAVETSSLDDFFG